MVMSRRTIKEIIYGMEESFVPENAEGVETILQYSFSGEGGGDYFVEVKDGSAKAFEGVNPSANLTFRADAQDYISMDSGELSGVQAFFKKKLVMEGDTKIASKMPKYFKPREK